MLGAFESRAYPGATHAVHGAIAIYPAVSTRHQNYRVWPKGGREMEHKTLHDTLQQGLALVDFNASWCAPCRAQSPIVERLAEQFAGKVDIKALDIDENREMAQALGVHSIPTLVLFRDGKEIQRFIGLQSEKTLSAAILDQLA